MNFIKNMDGSYILRDPILSPLEDSLRRESDVSSGLPIYPTFHDPEIFSVLDLSSIIDHPYQETSPVSPSNQQFPLKDGSQMSCHMCHKLFKHRGDVIRHIQNVHAQREPCIFCGKQLKINGRSDAKIKHFSRCPRFISLVQDKSLGMPELAKRAYHLLKNKIPVSQTSLKLNISQIQDFSRITKENKVAKARIGNALEEPERALPLPRIDFDL